MLHEMAGWMNDVTNDEAQKYNYSPNRQCPIRIFLRAPRLRQQSAATGNG
jgi:hypothetical protein